MKRKISKREKAILRRKLSKMALSNTQIAVYWVTPNGIRYSKIYKNLDQAEQARSWLIKQNVDPTNIELAVVKEVKNESEPTAQ